MSNWVTDFLTFNPDKAVLPVVKRAKHSIHFGRPDGQIESYFTGAPQHYLDTDNSWKPIDTNLIKVGSEYGSPGLNVRIKKDGTARLLTEDYSHCVKSVGFFNVEKQEFSKIKSFPPGKLDGDKLISEMGTLRRETKLTETGLREELIISEFPGNVSGRENDWFVLETEVSGISFANGQIDKFKLGNVSFPVPKGYDAGGNNAPCKRFAKIIGGAQYLYVGVPLSWLETAIYPVLIDPDFSDDDADGYLGGASFNYSTARNTVYNLDDTDSIIYIGQQYYSFSYYVYRGYLKFDTSAIPAENTISQVNLKLVCIQDQSATNFDVQIVRQTWVDPLIDDYANSYTGCRDGTADSNIWRNTNGMSINTQYTSGDLSVAWVVKAGFTYYSLRSSRDYSATSPSGAEYITIASNDHATSGYRPILTVLHASLSNPRMGFINYANGAGVA